MKLIVITPSKNIENEHAILRQMLDMGLSDLHVRKPTLSKASLKNYLNEFTKEQRKKIIIHTYPGLFSSYQLKGIHVSKKKRDKKIWFYLTKFRLKLFRQPITIETFMVSTHF